MLPVSGTAAGPASPLATARSRSGRRRLTVARSLLPVRRPSGDAEITFPCGLVVVRSVFPAIGRGCGRAAGTQDHHPGAVLVECTFVIRDRPGLLAGPRGRRNKDTRAFVRSRTLLRLAPGHAGRDGCPPTRRTHPPHQQRVTAGSPAARKVADDALSQAAQCAPDAAAHMRDTRGAPGHRRRNRRGGVAPFRRRGLPAMSPTRRTQCTEFTRSTHRAARTDLHGTRWTSEHV